MKEFDFLPVVLGSDMNAYGTVRMFHEAYGVRSKVFAKVAYAPIRYSKIADCELSHDLGSDEVLVQKLIEFAKTQNGKPLILFGCSDGYIKAIAENREALSEYYKIPYADNELRKTLTEKEGFYGVCARYSLDFPKTDIVCSEDFEKKSEELDFPVIIKASDSVSYWTCDFEGKMKVFAAKSKEEFDEICKAIYSSTYDGHLVVQDFIPGDDSKMRVLNYYCDKNGKAKMAAMGHPLLEEHTPQGIGSYAAIIGDYDEDLIEAGKRLLEGEGYTGFANFDVKYDERDGKFKFFELNPRLGRSSYFVQACGLNPVKFAVNDLIYNQELIYTVLKSEGMWSAISNSILFKYLKDKELIKKAKHLIRYGKRFNSLYYKKDLSLKRRISLWLYSANFYRKYRKYYGKKGLNK